jgi:hypothetical protein
MVKSQLRQLEYPVLSQFKARKFLRLLNTVIIFMTSIGSVISTADSLIKLANKAANTYSQATELYSQLSEMSSSSESERSQKRARREATAIAQKVTGNSGAGLRSNMGVVPAMFIAGRGAELGHVESNFCRPVKLKTGESNGAKYHNAFASIAKAFTGVKTDMAFGFKAILDTSATANATSQFTRFVTHNVFRQPANFNISTYANNTTNWNFTLGPDTSLIRKLPANGGSYQGASVDSVVTNFNSTLKSPFRYPTNGAWMYSRLCRPMLENIGWNCNPIKLKAIDGGNGSMTSQVSLQVYDDANLIAQNATTPLTRSMPNQQPQDATVADTTSGTSCYYRCQQGTGKVTYQFCNDSTSVLVVDVVINRVKKGSTLDPSSSETNNQLTDLYEAYGQGYLNYQLANRGVVDLNGSVPVKDDVFYNAKSTFMPAVALKYYGQVTTNGGTVKTHPFKQVARDQFMVPAGSTRPFSFDLQSLNYDARPYDETGLAIIDDMTYIVSLAFSSVATPAIEQSSAANPGLGQKYTVIDRKGPSVNCTVTGVYHENVYPAYMAEFVNKYYVNGALGVPKYDTIGTTSVFAADILDITQRVGYDTVNSTVAEVGPLNVRAGL